MTAHRARLAIAALAGACALLLATIAVNSLGWIDAPFPGFFVMRNRVVPSIALPDWCDGRAPGYFQQQIVAVDGSPVGSARDAYARATPDGRRVAWTLRRPDGTTHTATETARRFTGRDHVLVFGAFLLNGVAFLLAGLLVAFLAPGNPASVGLLATGLAIGVFVTTAVDLYGPYWFVRLHVFAESMLAPAVVHLATVFPTVRLGPRRRPALALLYGGFAAFALVYEVVFDWPTAYTRVHTLASAAHGIAALLLIGRVLHELRTSPSALVRRRVGVVALGTLAAFGVPAVTMGGSALFGWQVALNVGAFTSLLFPVSLGYAVVKQDLFEIDVFLRRATSYVVVLVLVGCVYLGVLSGLGAYLPGEARSPLAVAALNLAVLFLIAPIQSRVQDAIDRVFFRKRYDADEALAELSHRLVAAHTVPDVVAETSAMFAATMCPTATRAWAWEPGGTLRPMDGTGGTVALPEPLASRLARGELVTRYEWEDGTGRMLPACWTALAADVLVPVRTDGPPLAILALATKASGRAYTADDVAFLRGAASQVALALTNAGAFARLAELNASLEGQVRDRTAALAASNRELERSLEELRAAYEQNERSQASLIRADRLATLGRLTAGIAHEVNTPLGATLASLTLAADLAQEYAESIDDAAVGPPDHREIARDLGEAIGAATRWARKAAAFISKVRVHGREPMATGATRFRLTAVIDEVRALLAHRLRTSCCQLDVVDEAGDASFPGEGSRLGQVLVNLIANALDAYEERGLAESRIEIRMRRTEGAVVVTVRDWAGGIEPTIVARIFDELFTTKEPGRGTGLGLWISRNLVEQTFGGTLTVGSEPGIGSCFTLTLPEAAREPAPLATAV